MTTKKLLETTYDFSTVPPFVVRGDGKPLTDDVINLSANESPFGPSLLVRDAMAEEMRVDEKVFVMDAKKDFLDHQWSSYKKSRIKEFITDTERLAKFENIYKGLYIKFLLSLIR